MSKNNEFLENVKQRFEKAYKNMPESKRQEIKKLQEVDQQALELNEKYNIPERYHNATFENFNADTTEQKEALEIIKKQAWTKNIYLSGTVGTGKTHLAMCLKRQGAKYYHLSEIFRKVKSDFSHEQRLIDDLGSVKLLIVDEVGRQRFSDFEKSLFFAIIDKRWQNVKPTLIISNLSCKEFSEEYGNAVLDRLRPILLTLSGESKR